MILSTPGLYSITNMASLHVVSRLYLMVHINVVLTILSIHANASSLFVPLYKA